MYKQAGREQALRTLGLDKHASLITMLGDPLTTSGLVGGLALGKTVAMNAIARNAKHIPGVPTFARNIAGMGYRAAQQGRPLGAKPVRAFASAFSDPKLVDLYEGGYMLGHHVGPKGKELRHNMQDVAKYIDHPRINEYLDLAEEFAHAPTTRVQRALDYGATPISQVPGDARNAARNAANRAHIYATQTHPKQIAGDVAQVGRTVGNAALQTGRRLGQQAGQSLRQGANYLTTPVSQVGRDIGNVGRNVGAAAKRLVTNDPLPTPLWKQLP